MAIYHPIKYTANASLFIQFLTAIVDLYVLLIYVPKKYLVVKQLLLLEFIVQIVEGSFYVWLALAFHTIKNVTPYRYYDWYITTPTMLTSLSVYLIFLKNKEELKNQNSNDSENNDEDDIKNEDFFTIIKNNSKTITYILILNAIMLTFGLLNEHHILNKYIAVFLGFIPFFAMFYLIYENYAKYSEKGFVLFKYFSFVWSLYGIAALMSYHWKNIFYNILDLFAKNFFGLYLAYVLYFSID
jgi:hypothetical protein